MTKEIKYTTVEDYPVVRDGEYETRGGMKAVVLGFTKDKHGRLEVIGAVMEPHATPINWVCNGEQEGSKEAYDLMRPWVEEKPEAPVDKAEGCENKENHIGYEIRGTGTWEPCRDCNDNWVSCENEEEKPEKQTLFKGLTLDNALEILKKHLEQ